MTQRITRRGYQALVVLLVGLAACGGCQKAAPPPRKSPPPQPVVLPELPAPAGLKPAAFPKLPFDLAQAAGADQIKLAPAERDRLAAHGFLVIAPQADRMADCYSDTLPHFVTVDAVADQFLRDFEDAWAELEWEQQARLYDFQQKLWDGVYLLVPQLPEGELAEAGRRLLGLLSVARRTADPEWSPPLDQPEALNQPEWVARITREWRALETGEGPEDSELWKRKVDWSALQPVGRYAEDDEAGRFYRVRGWWRQHGFRSTDREEQLCALILLWSMFADIATDLPENSGPLDWQFDEAGPFVQALQMETAYERFLGRPREMPLLGLLDAFIKANHDKSLENVEQVVEKWQPAMARVLAKEIKQRKKAGLPMPTDGDGRPYLEIKLCPRRLTADEQPLLRLVAAERPLPQGLDLLAAYGSRRAREQRLADEPDGSRESLAKQLDQAAQAPEVGRLDELLAFQPCLRRLTLELATPDNDERLPLAMRTAAWHDRQLASALGFWAGMREVFAPKIPPPEEIDEPEALAGIAEPQLEAWQRLIELWYAADTAFKWSDVELSNESLYWALVFRRIARKQLRGDPLTDDELAQFGEFALRMSERADGGDRLGVDDRSVAIVARGMSPRQQRLAGKLYAQLYIVVEYDGRLHLCQGGVFDYVETDLPADRVISPQAFRALMDFDQAPKPPAWSEKYRP